MQSDSTELPTTSSHHIKEPQVQASPTPSNQPYVTMNASLSSVILQPSDQFINNVMAINYKYNISKYSNFFLNEEKIDKTPLATKLCKWIVDFHVSHNCVNALLLILRSDDLPKHTRTLVKTPKPKDHSIISIHPGRG